MEQVLELDGLTDEQLLEKIESGDIGDKVISLVSVYGHTGSIANIGPTKDKMTRQWLGIPNLSKDALEKLDFYLTKYDSIDVKHGTTFDLNDDIQLAHWDMVKHSVIIQITEDSAQSTPGAMFYIDMPSVSNKIEVDSEKLSHKAIGFILNDTHENLVFRARLLKVGMENDATEDLQNVLISIAKKNPKKIITLYKANSVSLKLLFYKALDYNIILKDNQGIYKFGIQILGTNEEEAFDFITNPQMELLVNQLKDSVDKASGKSTFNNNLNTDSEKIDDKTELDTLSKNVSENNELLSNGLVQLKEMAALVGAPADIIKSCMSKVKVIALIEQYKDK